MTAPDPDGRVGPAGSGDEGQQQGIQSVEIGARVLGALETGRGAMTLSEVARGSDMSAAKAHRYLVSLVRAGLAARDPRTGRYDLGPSARRLGIEALRRTDAESLVSVRALRLRDETGHTVDVASWTDGGPVITRWESGRHALPMVVRIGSVLPLLDSALGLVFLAHLPPAQSAGALAAQQERQETRTLAPAEQHELLAEVRHRGYASALNNMIYGMGAYGAPVFGADGSLALAVGLAVPARLVAEGRATGLVDDLLTATADASAALGHRTDPAPTTHRRPGDDR
jgi:DNA-binding IclR family transcriptional regulator